jgi:hypothetical protein
VVEDFVEVVNAALNVVTQPFLSRDVRFVRQAKGPVPSPAEARMMVFTPGTKRRSI